MSRVNFYTFHAFFTVLGVKSQYNGRRCPPCALFSRLYIWLCIPSECHFFLLKNLPSLYPLSLSKCPLFFVNLCLLPLFMAYYLPLLYPLRLCLFLRFLPSFCIFLPLACFLVPLPSLCPHLALFCILHYTCKRGQIECKKRAMTTAHEMCNNGKKRVQRGQKIPKPETGTGFFQGSGISIVPDGAKNSCYDLWNSWTILRRYPGQSW